MSIQSSILGTPTYQFSRLRGWAAGLLLIAVAACGDSRQQGSRPPDSPAAAVKGGATTPAASRRTIVVNGVDLTALGYDRGNAAAPTAVVEFSDFGCPFCREFATETFPAIDSEFIRTGKVYFKYVPFVIGSFPNATEAARAAECAGEQNKFWEVYDRLFRGQSEWKGESSPGPLLARYAVDAGLDRPHFNSCYASGAAHPATVRANEAAQALGVRVTPSFIVNGRPVEGALPLAEFRRLLAEPAK